MDSALDDLPVYVVTRHGDTACFDCLCGDQHTHGVAGMMPGVPEHRMAHCRTNVHPHGYMIMLPNGP